MTDDPIMSEITAAGALLRNGDRAGARARFEALWPRISGGEQPYYECAFSHIMADVQEDPAEELAWDLRALAAAERCTDGDVQKHGQVMSISTFMPSLHASLAGDYYKLGDFGLCREHLALARQFVDQLADDSYGQLIRHGIERIARGLAAREAR